RTGRVRSTTISAGRISTPATSIAHSSCSSEPSKRGCVIRTTSRRSSGRTTRSRKRRKPSPRRSVLLYDSPVSGNCYKVRLLLAHLGIPYERRAMDVVDRSNRREALGHLNPSLRVPTLVLDDGKPLGESNAILWYFGEGTRFV